MGSKFTKIVKQSSQRSPIISMSFFFLADQENPNGKLASLETVDSERLGSFSFLLALFFFFHKKKKRADPCIGQEFLAELCEKGKITKDFQELFRLHLQILIFWTPMNIIHCFKFVQLRIRNYC